MAIVVVLSVFNGFSALSESHLSKIDPDLQLLPVSGRMISGADSIADVISGIGSIKAASPMIEERAMLVSNHGQQPVVFRAIGDSHSDILSPDSIMIDGGYIPAADSIAGIQISVGVANRTGLRPGYGSVADIYVPRRRGRINPANPLASFISRPAMVTGVFQTDQADIDNDHIIIPLSTARQLLGYDSEATAIDIALTPGTDIREAATAITALIGDGFEMLDRRMQQEEAFRMIEIEKWVTFMMLMFILLIASFNILSTLSLMVVEKKEDSEIFRALGATAAFVRSIFISQGFLITVLGGLAGIVVGVILSLLQQHFGLIRLAGDPEALTIAVYPVAVSPADILAIGAAVIAIASLTSQTTRLFTRNIR